MGFPGYIEAEDKYALILDFMKSGHNSKWDIFSKIERHYIDNHYTYNLIKGNRSVLFRELYNGAIINEIELYLDQLHWSLLCLCNKCIQSLQEISEILATDHPKIIEVIEDLKKEGLVYADATYSEVVSIINTDILK